MRGSWSMRQLSLVICSAAFCAAAVPYSRIPVGCDNEATAHAASSAISNIGKFPTINEPIKPAASSGNPFLYGNGFANVGVSSTSSAISYTGNPFLNGGPQSASSASSYVHVPQYKIQHPKPADANDRVELAVNRESTIYQLPTVIYPPKLEPDHGADQRFVGLTCTGEGRICVKRHICSSDGYVLTEGLTQVRSEPQTCIPDSEVCCTLGSPDQTAAGTVSGGIFDTGNINGREFDLGNGDAVITNGLAESNGYLPPIGSAPSSNVPAFSSPPKDEEPDRSGGSNSPVPSSIFPPAPVSPLQVGCAAALLCVEEQFCTLEGVISPEPVALTSAQLIRRVPLSSCKNPDNGVIGKCCRDPNYVDPWPTGNLPANYSGGFDEQGFPTIFNLSKVRPAQKPAPIVVDETKNIRVSVSTPQIFAQIPQVPENALRVGNHYDASSSNENRAYVAPQVPSDYCGVRNVVERPGGLNDVDVAFGEIPWQAMVLSNTDRKLLCSGAIIAPNAVVTSARCVEGLRPEQVSIKSGEWKLGYELKHEEPLPFEIVNVASIAPYSGNDIAVLLLERDIKFDRHVNTLCLPEGRPISPPRPDGRCIATGWGKTVLQVNVAGALMHGIDVDVLNKDQCLQRLSGAETQIPLYEGIFCAKASKRNNNMCQVDFGGPLACDRGDGRYELAGIYTQDTGCLPTNQVATFATIPTSWLQETMTTITNPSTINDYRSQTNVEVRRDPLPTSPNQYLPPV